MAELKLNPAILEMIAATGWSSFKFGSGLI
jgi:hypothetical protein